ncbi:DeoR/GlpR family DNA-binding transcription regulator [Lachnospiraceae bacterium 62-35]
MLKSERLSQIQDMLNQYGKVEVNNLCRIFHVTEMTIRRDLNELEKNHRAIRSHGGAIAPPDNMLSERPYNVRIHSHLREKEAIAAMALPLIPDGSRIFFDSSTTVYCLARLITNAQNLVVVTDTLSTALELNTRTNIHVICLGGELQKNTNSCAGMFAENTLDSMYFDFAFMGLGLHGISEDGTLSTTSTIEFSLKRKVIERTKHVVIMVDSSKLGAPSFLQMGHISEIQTLITDSGIPESFLETCRKANVEVLIAPIN